MSPVETLTWKDGALHVLDQLRLPSLVQYVVCRSPEQVAETIRRMQIRGAPAIGVAAAFGMALAARSYEGSGGEEFDARWKEASELLAATRPTAVNLFWALDRMQKLFDRIGSKDLAHLADAALAIASKIHRDDVESCRAIGRHGLGLVGQGANVLTHCNAGALATAGYGTALGVIRAAHEAGKEIHIWVDETRPYLQGARLTTWELDQERIPHTLVADNMAGALMQQGRVDLVVVGADRIAANGDVANKIGTYALAVLCHYHHVPFFVAAPLSTIDRSITEPSQVKIEERPPTELSRFAGVDLAPAGVRVYNPSFDVTPRYLVSAIITQVGVLHAPYSRSIARAFDRHAIAEDPGEP
jgi:methylthioribose-1-phosphate isomerase